MDNNALAKLSAVTRVCQKFTELCEAEKVDLFSAVSALNRLLGNPSPSEPSSQPFRAVIETKQQALTREQADKAKELARIEKAKRLGISPREINLTPTEAKEAKRQFLQSLVSGTHMAPAPTSTPVRVEGVAEATPKQQVTGSKKQVGLRMDPTGSRSTAKTRIDNFRRAALRAFPPAVSDPVGLHLVAYANHWTRLFSQVQSYRNTYEDSGMLDPMRGLPDPKSLFETKKLLLKLVQGLREQSDSPGTYVLQTDIGGSYWNRDQPSADCPSNLTQRLPSLVFNELESAASGKINRSSPSPSRGGKGTGMG